MAQGKNYRALSSRNLNLGVCVGLAGLILTGCGSAQNGLSSDVPGGHQSNNASLTGPDTNAGHSLRAVSSWALMNEAALGHKPTLEEVAHSDANLLIINPALVTSDPKLVSKRLQDIKGSGSRRVIAMVDVAKITPASLAWNSAWQPKKAGVLPIGAPSWLHPATSVDQTVFDVTFWDGEWRAALGGQCARLIDAGFDGIALTGCDAYGEAAKTHPTAAADMAGLIKAVGDAERAKNSNATLIFDDPYFPGKLGDKDRKTFLDGVDGVTATRIFYGDPASADHTPNPNADLIAALDTLDRAGKKVLAWEQISGSDRAADFDARARTRGYLPFVPKPSDATHTAKSGSPQTAAAESNSASPAAVPTEQPIDGQKTNDSGQPSSAPATVYHL